MASGKTQLDVLTDFMTRFNKAAIRSEASPGGIADPLALISLTYQSAAGGPTSTLTIRPSIHNGKPVLVVSESGRG